MIFCNTSFESKRRLSFQATKIITTVDGGALVCKNKNDYKRAKLLRWYGIDRDTNKQNIDVDITEAGFKYHMHDVEASIGVASLVYLKKLRNHRIKLQETYHQYLNQITNIKAIGGSPFLIHAENRDKLISYLGNRGIEAGLVHKRNDIYSIFGGKRQWLTNMNRLEKTYLLLPCHYQLKTSDVEFICSSIQKFYHK